jgi:hypothetical protein
MLSDGYTWKDADTFFVNSGFYLIDGTNVEKTAELAAAATEALKASFLDYFQAP